MKLTEKRYEAFAKLASEVDQRVERATSLYNKLIKESGIGYRDEDLLHNGRVYLDCLDNSLYIDWDVTWSYGGHANGSNNIPLRFLLDDTWEKEVTEAAKVKIKKAEGKKRKQRRDKTAAEKAELARLKAKYE